MTRVKVCGLTAREDLEATVAAGTDAVGLICGVETATPRRSEERRVGKECRL